MLQKNGGCKVLMQIKKTLQSWNLDSKIQVCLTTNNGSIILCSKTILGWTHLPYFGHNLHLVIRHSLKDDTHIACAVGICKKLVSTFPYSFNKKQDLTEAQRECRLPEQPLVTNCQIHQGSSEKMIGHVLEEEKKGISACSKLAGLESINAALNRLSDFTDMLSAKDYRNQLFIRINNFHDRNFIVK